MLAVVTILLGFPGGSDGKESTLKCRRPGFDPWVRKMPWRREWQPTPIFLAWKIPWTEEPGQIQSMGHKKSNTTEYNTVTVYQLEEVPLYLSLQKVFNNE